MNRFAAAAATASLMPAMSTRFHCGGTSGKKGTEYHVPMSCAVVMLCSSAGFQL